MFAPKAIFLSLILVSSTAFAQQGDDAKVFYNKRIDALWTVGGHDTPEPKATQLASPIRPSRMAPD
jgi:hypothetical protein